MDHLMSTADNKALGIRRHLLKLFIFNGLVERMNRTLVERVRCLLSETKLPKFFQGEGLYTTAYVINLSPTIALQAYVLDRVWYGKVVSYDHLWVFGYKAFVHVSKDERSKLDVKTK